jgi:tetratricopeptide (TPR) repeat protein
VLTTSLLLCALARGQEPVLPALPVLELDLRATATGESRRAAKRISELSAADAQEIVPEERRAEKETRFSEIRQQLQSLIEEEAPRSGRSAASSAAVPGNRSVLETSPVGRLVPLGEELPHDGPAGPHGPWANELVPAIEPGVEPRGVTGRAVGQPATGGSGGPDSPMTDPVDRLGLADSLFAAGESALALETYQALDLAGLSPEDLQWIAFQQASCLRRLGRMDEATQAYRRLASEPAGGWLVELSRWWLDSLAEATQLRRQSTEFTRLLESQEGPHDMPTQ